MNKIHFYRPSKPITNSENDFDGSSLSTRSNNLQTSINREKNSQCLSTSIQNPNPIKNIGSKKLKLKIKIKSKSKSKTNELELKKKNAGHQLRDRCFDGSERKNSLYASLENRDKKYGILKFFLFKLLIPILIFASFILALILLQIFVEDFCFYPSLCQCQGFEVFLYSSFREFLQFDFLLIAFFYYLNSYLTNNFFQKKYLKILYFVIQFLGFVIFFAAFYFHKNEETLATMRFIRSFISLGLNVLYVFFLELIFRQISKKFVKKMVIIALFAGFYFLHGLYLKNTFSFNLLFFFKQNFSYPLNLYLFKLALLVYYLIYKLISKSFLFHIYKDIVLETNNFSINMIITTTKFLHIDVLSIQVMNILTIPLSEIYSWICFVSYAYSMISVYLDINIFQYFSTYIRKKFFGKKDVPIKPKENIFFENLKRGCILEANFIIFLRIFIHHYFNYFFYITKAKALFLNCKLEASQFDIHLPINNILLIFCSHFGLIVMIFIYMIRKKKQLINLVVEDFSLIIRGMIFIIYYTQTDTCIQFFILLQISA